MQQGGVYNNPLVDMAQYRNTLAKMLELAGYKDPDMFFKDPSLAPPPPPPAPPPPSPEEILAQVQAQSIQADIQKKAAELELQREEMMRKDDRERDKLDADMMIKAAEIEAKYGAQVNTANIQALMQRDREFVRQQGEIQRAAVAPAPAPAPAPTSIPQTPPEGIM